MRVLHAGREVALHTGSKGRHGRVTDDSHLTSIAGAQGRPIRMASTSGVSVEPLPMLLRPLAEYEAAIGGGS